MKKHLFNHYKIHLTIAFAIFILLIILLANTGNLARIFKYTGTNWPWFDKISHFCLMGFLCLLLLLSLSQKYSFKKASIISLIIMFSFTTMEEFSQRFIEYRNFSLRDLAANYTGIISFYMIGFINHNIQFKKTKAIFYTKNISK